MSDSTPRAWHQIKQAFDRFVEASLDRVRNEPNLEWLVAQGLQLGEHTHIGHPLYIDRNRPWLITIGDYVTIAPQCALVTHDPTLAQHTGQTRIGRIDIGKRVMVGVGAILLPGTRIGEDSVIGAGAVVHGEIPPQSVVIGNPGKASPIKAAVAWHRVSAARAPTWPSDGWSIAEITEERKREQREALADCVSGFVPARPAPGSPYALKQRGNSPAGPEGADSVADQPAPSSG